MSVQAAHGSISSRAHTSKGSSKSKHSSKSKSSTASVRIQTKSKASSTSQTIDYPSTRVPHPCHQQPQHSSWQKCDTSGPLTSCSCDVYTHYPSWGQHDTSEPLIQYHNNPTHGHQPQHSQWQQTSEMSKQLTCYLNDSTHSNPGYSAGYTNALIHTYGFPDLQTDISEVENEMVEEAESRARRTIDDFYSRMKND